MTLKSVCFEQKVKAFSTEPARIYKIEIESDATIWVYDSIAHSYTTVHQLKISDLVPEICIYDKDTSALLCKIKLGADWAEVVFRQLQNIRDSKRFSYVEQVRLETSWVRESDDLGLCDTDMTIEQIQRQLKPPFLLSLLAEKSVLKDAP
jgi:hypothetical protein